MKLLKEWIDKGKPILYYTGKRTCIVCEKIFHPKQSSKSVCCSKKCMGIMFRELYRLGIRKKTLPKSRPWDGKKRPQFSGKNHPMYGRHHSIFVRNKISRKTREAWDSGIVYGSNYLIHQSRAQKEAAKIRPNYNNGSSSLSIRIRGCSFYGNWRDDIFRRDNFVCYDCGRRGGVLNAHHLISFNVLIKKYGIKELDQAIACAEFWDKSNGITLCKKCHAIRHAAGRGST
jgi:hypothetical protein